MTDHLPPTPFSSTGLTLGPQLQTSLEDALTNPLEASPLQLWDAIAQWLIRREVELTLEQRMRFMAHIFTQIIGLCWSPTTHELAFSLGKYVQVWGSN